MKKRYQVSFLTNDDISILNGRLSGELSTFCTSIISVLMASSTKKIFVYGISPLSNEIESFELAKGFSDVFSSLKIKTLVLSFAENSRFKMNIMKESAHFDKTFGSMFQLNEFVSFCNPDPSFLIDGSLSDFNVELNNLKATFQKIIIEIPRLIDVQNLSSFASVLDILFVPAKYGVGKRRDIDDASKIMNKFPQKCAFVYLGPVTGVLKEKQHFDRGKLSLIL